MRNRILFFLTGLILIVSCKKERELPPSPGRMIKEFRLESGQYGNATIYTDNDIFKVLVQITTETDPSKITPIITGHPHPQPQQAQSSIMAMPPTMWPI